MPVGRVLVALVAFTYTAAAVAIPRAHAQQQALPADYRVGPGDSVFLSVPQRPDLNRELVVDAKGEVNLPLIGKVLVRGMTDSELEGRLLQSLREYYPSVNKVEVSITRASSNVIWVSGDVKIPGKYSFSQPANVWEAIREAGGPNPTASLDAVRIIKDRTRGGSTTVVDVTAAMEGGSVDKLPLLDPGDTIIVSAKQQTYTGSQGVNVLGGVLTPGVYPMQGRQDLMTAILQAGARTAPSWTTFASSVPAPADRRRPSRSTSTTTWRRATSPPIRCCARATPCRSLARASPARN
jgi:protein involved in polysaccharide export with SLBB domain